ncbi:MAG: carboxypeptidase regulatory-like domain-containing protein [Sphingobacteriia bacterium]|nr:MAG: carboxypeptidase regulatory-like domain-containing protein [Sphingobacteriia bacterium]
MRLRKTLLILLISCNYLTLLAQDNKAILKGSVSDTINKQQLGNAVVALLRQKDSVLVKFTRTLKDGSFEFDNLVAGKYLMMISYPKYADYVDKIVLEKNQVNNVGAIAVITKATLLQEVIVRQRIGAIRVKGDTTEYKADSFKVSANADVQELLRKMPGIQVNGKGEITAQGERVQKVLVDGEEFFSDDPAVVTKNLRADAVDKVQAFDKKSDQVTKTNPQNQICRILLYLKQKKYFKELSAILAN